MSFQRDANRFIAEIDQYRDGLLDSPPQLDYMLLGAIGSFYFKAAADPGVLDPAAPATIKMLLRAIAPSAVPWTKDYGLLMAAINNHSCLRTCVSSEEDAYALASVLVAYVETHTSEIMTNLVVEPHACRLLKEWLAPDAEWESLPSVDTICRHLFEESWCSIVLPESAMTQPNTDPLEDKLVANLISRDRPRFLPGLCPSQVPAESKPLPVDLGNTSCA